MLCISTYEVISAWNVLPFDFALVFSYSDASSDRAPDTLHIAHIQITHEGYYGSMSGCGVSLASAHEISE